MIGSVRRQEGATGNGLPREVSALVLEECGMRVVLCGVDTLYALPILASGKQEAVPSHKDDRALLVDKLHLGEFARGPSRLENHHGRFRPSRFKSLPSAS